jgi:hypothetical protein
MVANYAGLHTGVRFFDAPDVPSAIGNFSLSTVGATEALDVGIKISDAVGIRVSGFARALIGSNTPSLVYEGATYEYGGTGGVIIRFLKIDETGTQLAVHPYFQLTTGQVASILPIFNAGPVATLQSILSGNGRSFLITPLHRSNFGALLNFAQVFGPVLSLQLDFGLQRYDITVEPFDANINARAKNSTDGLGVDAGAAFAVDGASAGIPLAGMVEYAVSRQAGATNLVINPEVETVSTFVISGYYTGRRDLQLGLGGALERGIDHIFTPQGDSGTPNAWNLFLTLRYIW